MKLLKCHIENFGKFNSFDYVFSGGLNEFCEENGYGKTTIAAFIKAMFYGMPSYRRNGVGFTDREHYAPFGGGKYGGSLTFLWKGAEYRIERFFGGRSDTADTLEVYRNNMRDDSFDKDIGMAVFGIDRQSFERTAFIDSRVVEIESTDSISTRLNADAGGTDGDKTFTKALETLTQAARDYIPARGNGGKVNAARAEIAALQNKIGELEEVAASLAEMNARCNALRQEISVLEDKKERADRAAVISEKWDRYEDYAAQAKAANEKYLAIISVYPQGIPAAEEIAALKKYYSEKEKNNNIMQAALFGGEQKERLEQLERQFAGGVPSEEDIAAAECSADRCRVLEGDINRLKTDSPDQRYETLERRFHGNMPGQSAVNKCEENIRLLADVNGRIDARMSAAQPEKKKGGKWHIFAAVAAIIFLFCGVALIFFNTIAGAVVAAAGAVMLAVAVIIYLKTVKRAPAAVVDDTLADLQYKKNKYTQEIHAFLAAYNYYSASAESDFATFTADLQYYISVKERLSRASEDAARTTAELEELQEKLDCYFSRYGIQGDNYNGMCARLRALIAELTTLRSAEERSRLTHSAAEENMGAAEKAIKGILAKYGIQYSADESIVEKLENAAREAARLKTEAARLEGLAQAFKRQNGLTERPVAGQADQTLAEELKDKRNGRASLESEISRAEGEVARLDGLKAALAEAEERLEVYLHKHRVLSAAATLLAEAQQRLTDKYVLPVKGTFSYYADKIERALGEKVVMDGNFNVSFERDGLITKNDHLSAGQRTVCALCFRLALIDNMYKGESPFIIMDDPFVNLDEGHLDDVKKLVRQLAADRQIVYFCCHPSRKITR